MSARQKTKFLTVLEEKSNGSPINSKTLREAIGWQNNTYERVRRELLEEGLIKVAVGGPGGAVQLGKSTKTRALSVFISYCHEDEGMKDKLVKHLTPLKRKGLLSDWHDRKITAGENWDLTISSNLERAALVLLLISIDFINSEYCYDIEMDSALKRHDANECRVIPILLRNCIWQEAPFAKIHGLPKDMKAVSSWPNDDDAFVNIAQGIRLAAEKWLEENT